MPTLRFDPEQRFSCRSCARCCTTGWNIVLTPAEVELYRHTNAARLYREPGAAGEGTDLDPFEPLPAPEGAFRIRMRPDGVCGFLSAENRCRLHEELGEAKKPLTCRMFPFRFLPADGPPLATLHFGCPTVVANLGPALGSQVPELERLQREWARAWPQAERPLELVEGRPLAGGALGTLRSVLREMLDRPGADGAPDLRANVDRMARTLDDLTRLRVLRLPPADFAEYLELTGRFAARSDKPLPPRPPSRLGRLLFRGFLYLIAAGRLQLLDRRTSGLRLDLRLRLLALALHLHGLGPAVAGYDLGAARRARLDLADAPLRAIAHNYLRATIETLGGGERPVFEEICVAVAFLNAAGALAAMRAGSADEPTVSAERYAAGLMEAVDLAHAAGRVPALLATLAGGVDALYLFAAGPVLSGPGGTAPSRS